MKKYTMLFLMIFLLASCGKEEPKAGTVLPTSSPAPAQGDLTTTEPLSEMVFIPQGEFQMGCDPLHNGNFSCPVDELPLHNVTLGDYYIDRYEVTNEDYAACVSAGKCEIPNNLTSQTRSTYFLTPFFVDDCLDFIIFCKSSE